MSGDPQKSQVNLSNPVEIVITRVFAAPRELVWQAWTESKHAEKWWGPAGFTTTTHSQNFQVGGAWRYTMHGPDGKDYPNRTDYLEIDPPSRLVYSHGADEGGDLSVRFHMEVSFTPLGERGERTQVTMRSVFPSAEARDYVITNFNAAEGGKQHLANLEDYLDSLVDGAGNELAFSISQFFNAPLQQVWQAWTTQEALFRWFGPKGSTMLHATLDFKPGGVFHYCMSHPNGMEIWGRWVFRQIDSPHRIELLSSFSDASGKIVPPLFPGLELFPLETLTTITMVEHAGPSKGTLVTVQATPFQATPAQAEFFKAFHGSLQQGWSGTLTQLTAFLEG